MNLAGFQKSHGGFTSKWARTQRAAWRKVVATAAAACIAACSNGGAAGPVAPEPPRPSANDPVAGNFTLTTVNASALPHTLFNETGYVLAITSSALALQTGGQFVLAMVTRETVDGFPSTFHDTTRGTWSQNAGVVTLTSINGTPATAAWDGVKLSFSMEAESKPLALVYTREVAARVLAQSRP